MCYLPSPSPAQVYAPGAAHVGSVTFAHLAGGETVTLLHPLLPLVGVALGAWRGVQQISRLTPA